MFLRRWRPRHLVLAWIAYWIVLLVVVLWPAIAQWWRLQRTGGHGSVSVTLSAGGLETAWWVAGPPLLLWALWLRARTRSRRPEAAGDREPVA